MRSCSGATSRTIRKMGFRRASLEGTKQVWRDPGRRDHEKKCIRAEISLSFANKRARNSNIWGEQARGGLPMGFPVKKGQQA